MLTVEELWKTALPAGTRLTGGLDGLWHGVTWVTRMMPRPPGFRGLKGGELAIVATTAISTLDERLTLADLIKRLALKQIAAVLVSGEDSPQAAAVADELRLPLLVLPEGADLYEVEQATMRLILERRSELYQRGQRIFMQLTELAIDGAGMPAVLKRLSSIIGKTVAFEDEGLHLQLLLPVANGSLQANEGQRLLEANRRSLGDWTQSTPFVQGETPCGKLDLPGTDLARYVAPVRAKNKTWGYISVLGPRCQLAELERIATVRAAEACGIGIARDRAVLEARDLVQSDLVEDLLSGSFSDEKAMFVRGKQLGCTLEPPYAVLACAIQWEEGARATGSNGQLQAAITAIGRDLGRLEATSLYQANGDSLVILIPVKHDVQPTHLKKMAERLRTMLAPLLADGTTTIGFGRVYPGLKGVRDAYQEASQALNLGLRLFGAGSLTYYGELGIYKLLLSLQGNPGLKVFHDETLGKLLEYDRKHRAELVKTLKSYFAQSTCISRAADALHLHRNSLLYRLRRIEEIAGLSLEDSRVSLDLQLALCIGEILEATSSPSWSKRPSPYPCDPKLRQGHVLSPASAPLDDATFVPGPLPNPQLAVEGVIVGAQIW